MTGYFEKSRHFTEIPKEMQDKLIQDLENYEKTVPFLVKTEDLTNSFGFKDYEWKIEKSSNTYRIIALGDSMTEGVGVAINDTWPKQLEKKLNELNLSKKFEVLNMGKRGYNTYKELMTLKAIGLNYSPDMIILQYFHNDWEDPNIEIQSRELWVKYKKGEFKLPREIEEAMIKLNASDVSISRLLNQYLLIKYYSTVNWEEEWEKWVLPYLTEMITICKHRGIKLIVITWDLSKEQSSKLNDLFNKHHIPFYDFSNYFPPFHLNSKLRIPDGHLSQFGYEIVANKTAEELLNLFAKNETVSI
jgi:lysophospholipase L1-like esterase